MSTFNGLVSEFPDIRVDFFRQHAKAPPPLACFLSHVHSDHLAGLDNLRSPFVYCSAATREILLRLERYPCRINYAQGILEARQQTYKHLSKVLKPLPLETPTRIELRPGHHIQVTLFDANHCPGAVMFLIEGGGKAVLYTGDIRSEPWFVTTLARNPILIEYTCGLKTLDKIYLDTSFISNIPFQTKADGIAELLHKVSKYPVETIFHIQAWTYGYEEVWTALSRALNSPIHVDDYKMRIYNSLRSQSAEKQSTAEFHLAAGAAALTGHMCGNTPHQGCLTSDRGVRLHSCEKGNMCEEAKGPDVVSIQPIIARLPGGRKLEEAGVGGGGEDLEREAELSFPLKGDLLAMLELVSSSAAISKAEQNAIRRILGDVAASNGSLSLNLDTSSFREGQSTDLQAALRTLPQYPGHVQHTAPSRPTDGLARIIQFPYSRHSSYPELCDLVETFRPNDIWPCTVNPKEWVEEDISIKSLFGAFCSGRVFSHDLKMAAAALESARTDSPVAESQPMVAPSRRTCSPGENSPARDNTSVELSSPLAPSMPRDGSMPHRLVSLLPDSVPRNWEQLAGDELLDRDTCEPSVEKTVMEAQDSIVLARKRRHSELGGAGEDQEACLDDSQGTEASFSSAISTRHSLTRREAYSRMLDNAADHGSESITLLSTDGNHSIADKEP